MGIETPIMLEPVIYWKYCWHFHQRLWERYKIRLLPSERVVIERAIAAGALQPEPQSKRGIYAVYKYIHQPGTKQQVRIYIVAEQDTGKLVSVEKPKWRHQKNSKLSKQRRAEKGRRSKRSKR